MRPKEEMRRELLILRRSLSKERRKEGAYTLLERLYSRLQKFSTILSFGFCCKKLLVAKISL